MLMILRYAVVFQFYNMDKFVNLFNVCTEIYSSRIPTVSGRYGLFYQILDFG